MGPCWTGMQGGGWELCSEPRNLVAHLALLLQINCPLLSLSTLPEVACTCMPPASGSSLYVPCSGACLCFIPSSTVAESGGTGGFLPRS